MLMFAHVKQSSINFANKQHYSNLKVGELL